MSDPHQALGQKMHQEAPDELLPGQTYCLGGVSLPVVSVSEDHLPVVGLQDTSVADGKPVAVARQVAHTTLAVWCQDNVCCTPPTQSPSSGRAGRSSTSPDRVMLAEFSACCRLAKQSDTI